MGKNRSNATELRVQQYSHMSTVYWFSQCQWAHLVGERIRFSANSSGETGYPPEKRKRNLTPISHHTEKKNYLWEITDLNMKAKIIKL